MYPYSKGRSKGSSGKSIPPMSYYAPPIPMQNAPKYFSSSLPLRHARTRAGLVGPGEGRRGLGLRRNKPQQGFAEWTANGDDRFRQLNYNKDITIKPGSDTYFVNGKPWNTDMIKRFIPPDLTLPEGTITWDGGIISHTPEQLEGALAVGSGIFGGAISNPEGFALDKALAEKVPQFIRPPANAGQTKAKYTGREPQQIAEISNVDIAEKVSEKVGTGVSGFLQWTIRKGIQFAKWLADLIIDNFELAVEFIMNILGWAGPAGQGALMLWKFCKPYIAVAARMTKLIFQKTQWNHGESFWKYIANLTTNLITHIYFMGQNIILNIVNTFKSVGAALGSGTKVGEKFIPTDLISIQEWQGIFSGGVLSQAWRLYQNAKMFADMLQSIWDVVGDLAKSVSATWSVVKNAPGQIVQAGVDAGKAVAQAGVDTIVEGTKAVGGAIVGESALETALTVGDNLTGNVASNALKVYAGIKEWLETGAASAISGGESIAGTLSEASFYTATG
jgi:hypothetical protein